MLLAETIWKSVSLLLCFLQIFRHGACSGSILSDQECCSRDRTTLTYNCTIEGEAVGTTVWRGTAFDCPGSNNELSLLHSRFMSNEGILKECNDGAIVARSLGVDGKYFMSQLNVTVTSGILIGETILCVHDNSTQSRITFSTAIPTTVHQSPCNSIHINTVILSANEFSFNWSPALVNDCPVILYNILTSNCGICPTNSTHTNVTCIDVPVNSGVCTFTIQTVICGKVVVNSIAVNNIISAVITAEDSVVTQQEGCLGTVISTTLFALLLLISIAISIMMTIIYAKRVYEDTNPVSATQSLKRSTAAITTNENVAYVMTLPSERPN